MPHYATTTASYLKGGTGVSEVFPTTASACLVPNGWNARMALYIFFSRLGKHRHCCVSVIYTQCNTIEYTISSYLVYGEVGGS